MANPVLPAKQILDPLKLEFKKDHKVFSGANLIEFYEAVTSVKDGGICLRTDYSYDGSGNLTGKKESQGVWLAIWDI